LVVARCKMLFVLHGDGNSGQCRDGVLGESCALMLRTAGFSRKEADGARERTPLIAQAWLVSFVKSTAVDKPS